MRRCSDYEESNQPVRYCVGVLVATAPPVDGETASGQVVKGHLLWIRLVDKGDGPTLEWESRKLHTATTYTCSLAVVVELDPTLDMSKKTYVFSMDKLITTQNVIQETAENVQGWEAVPDVRPPPRGNVASLPLHDALTCKAGGALGEEDVPVASVDGNAECPLCFAEVVPKKLLQPMEGHILEDEVKRSYDYGYCFSRLSQLGVLKHPPNLTPRLAAPKGLPDMPEAESNYLHFW